jgi:hypothetical protein
LVIRGLLAHIFPPTMKQLSWNRPTTSSLNTLPTAWVRWWRLKSAIRDRISTLSRVYWRRSRNSLSYPNHFLQPSELACP